MRKTATSATPETVIELPRLELREIDITLVGDSPLICHKWSEKAKKAMLDKQMGKAAHAKEKKDPQRDYEESLYPHPGGGFGFPVVAFKAAAVDACTHIANMTKVAARGAFHINGEYVKIEGEPNPREDMVRVGMGTADIRYRGEFKEWRTTFRVRYNARVITAEQLLNLFNVAGFAIGVGEWRPQKDGSYGMFHVAGTEE